MRSGCGSSKSISSTPGETRRAVLRFRLAVRLEWPVPEDPPGALSPQPSIRMAEQDRQADTRQGSSCRRTQRGRQRPDGTAGADRHRGPALQGRDLYRWLLPWFSPRPDGFKDAWDYLKTRQYPEDETCIGDDCDLAEMITLGYPESREDGSWSFTGVPHRLISAAGDRYPAGDRCADRRTGDRPGQDRLALGSPAQGFHLCHHHRHPTPVPGEGPLRCHHQGGGAGFLRSHPGLEPGACGQGQHRGRDLALSGLFRGLCAGRDG